MTKGVSSSGSLKALAYPVQMFVTQWGAGMKPASTPSPGASAHLPAPYQLAALRGEGVLRQRFFEAFIPSLNIQLDAAQQINAWQQLIEDGGHLTTWVQRLGVAQALRREALLGAEQAQQSRQLYAILLDALAQQAPLLLPYAAERYFLHCWRQQFPSQAAPPKPRTDTDALRRRLLRNLRRLHGPQAELKESFQQSETQVSFSLLVQTQPGQPWASLLTLERPRLKTARLAAYQQAIAQTERETSATTPGQARQKTAS